MPPLTRIPLKLRYLLHGTQPLFHHRHHRLFGWSLVLTLVYQDKASLCGRTRFGPTPIAEWPIRRFLQAGYGCW
jgi:hypothetical protein